MILCEICGNDFEPEWPNPKRCPYCQSEQEGELFAAPDPVELHRLVNLEYNKPLVAQALARLDSELEVCRILGVRVLTLIHGYGSSGRGGRIREEARARLLFLERESRVESVIFGEDFESRSGRGRHLIRRYPFLKRHADLNRNNPGITVVLLARQRQDMPRQSVERQ